jgi:hypothetical protein
MNIRSQDAARLMPQAAAEAYWELFLRDMRR